LSEEFKTFKNKYVHIRYPLFKVQVCLSQSITLLYNTVYGIRETKLKRLNTNVVNY